MRNVEAGANAGPGTPAKKSVARIDPLIAHGALIAADAAIALYVYDWQRALDAKARSGEEFSADSMQSEFNLPSIGFAAGGVFMGASRRGIIRRVGYKCSDKRSRAGGVVGVWVGTARGEA